MIQAGSIKGLAVISLSPESMLLRILQDGRFHSGEAIGLELGVSRSAVWKKIKKINASGIASIHCVKGRGYKLANEINPLNPELHFQGVNFSWAVGLIDTVDSTNAEALRRLNSGISAPFALVAEQQTAGRGRRGRNWVSPYGENLYFSLALRVDQGMRQLEGLSLVIGLAVISALKNVGVSDVSLKWPNDVLVSGSKIAGVLLELTGDIADICHVIIGVGINANMSTAGSEISQKWTSVLRATGLQTDRNLLLTALQNQLDKYLGLHWTRGFSALKDEWERNHLWQGRSVFLSAGEKQISGRVVGVDASGALRLVVDGVEQRFSGGELSLRLQDDS